MLTRHLPPLLRSLVLSMLLSAPAAVVAEPGVVLHQEHRFSTHTRADTLRTYITARHVRIEHKNGDAILDLEQGRLVLLDRFARTWRQMPLEKWEAAIQQAAAQQHSGTGTDASGQVPEPAPAFQRIGKPVERAGYVCDRWGLYTRRELLPGEIDWVEQQIWVARELRMPPGAYEAYDRAIRAIDSIGMGALVQRPEGVVLASEIRVGSEAEHQQGNVEVESLTVFKVEEKELPDAVFTVPDDYAPARDADESSSGD